MTPPAPGTERLVRGLLDLADPRRPCLYGVSRRRRLARRPVDTVDQLIGWTAPSCWTAAALAAPPPPPPPPPPPTAPAPATAPATAIGPDGAEDIGLVHVVTRNGQGITGRRSAGHVDVLTDGTGPLDDLCHRIIGLGTPPPDTPARRFLDALWLDRVLAEALGRPRGAAGPCPDTVLELRPKAQGWPELRQSCAVGRLAIPGVEPADAAWFDDGSFARWVVRSTPDPCEALADLAHLHRRSSWEALRSGLERGT